MPTVPSPLRPGDSLETWSRSVCDAIRAIWPRPSSRVHPRIGGNGTSYSIIEAPGSPGGEPTKPFACVQSKDSGGNDQYYVYQGDLREGLGFTLQTIEGLTLQKDIDGTPAKDGAPAVPPTIYYRPLIATDAIWLELELDAAGSVLYAVIKSWGDGDDGFDALANFGTAGSVVEIDASDPTNVYVRYIRLLIAYSTPDPKTSAPILVQCVNTHLMLCAVAPNGYPCVYPFSCFKGYPGVLVGDLHGDPPGTGGGGGV